VNRNIKVRIFLLSFIFLVGQASAADVIVIPSTMTVFQGETFNLNILIDPKGTAIAGTHLNIRFNKSVININSIIEGNLFKQNRANTFFNSGTINNSLGTVVSIYNMVLGPYSVSTSGTFIIINATAVGVSGASGINLSNVMVSDPNGQAIALNLMNGNVNINRTSLDITPPNSVNNLKNISYAHKYINWTWIDPSNGDFAKVIVYLDGVYKNDVLKGVQYYNATVTPGTYIIGMRTVDTSGNINASMVTHTATTILPSVRYINGTIMDSVSMAGIPGVKVFINTSITTMTNATGFYSFTVVSGTYKVTATFEPMYYANSRTVSTSLGAFAEQDIELSKKPTGTIAGNVRNAW
jgi:hypothetical protein